MTALAKDTTVDVEKTDDQDDGRCVIKSESLGSGFLFTKKKKNFFPHVSSFLMACSSRARMTSAMKTQAEAPPPPWEDMASVPKG